VPLGLLFDPAGNGGDVHWAAGVDLQHRVAKAKRAHPAVQHGLQLRVQDVVDVAWVSGGCPPGEATLDLGGRAAAEDLDGPRLSMEPKQRVDPSDPISHHASVQPPRPMVRRQKWCA
jgi:hypothetical protein